MSKNSSSLRVFILTHGGQSVGFGHITRCLSLYRAFRSRRIKPVLILDVDNTTDQLLSSFPHERIAWIRAEQKALKRIDSADIIVLDSFMADEALYSQLNQVAKVPVYIDDYIRRTYTRGVVVDWTILAEKKFFSVKLPAVTYLLGSHYAALRQEFWKARTNFIRRRVTSVFISFGGNDVANMTPTVLKFLNKYYPSLAKRVVIGPGFQNLNEIEAYATPKVKFIFRPDARVMKANMQASDLAISAGGQTLYELARLGLPTIGLQVIDNQEDDIAGWNEVGFIAYVGTPSDANLQDRLQQSLVTLMDYEKRLSCSQIGKHFVDGAGAARIVDSILGIRHAGI